MSAGGQLKEPIDYFLKTLKNQFLTYGSSCLEVRIQKGGMASFEQ
jgi:hypothetical protein